MKSAVGLCGKARNEFVYDRCLKGFNELGRFPTFFHIRATLLKRPVYLTLHLTPSEKGSTVANSFFLECNFFFRRELI